MRLRRVRFSIRRLLVAVALFALVFAGEEATRRRWESLASVYRGKAGRCEHVALVALHSSDLEAARGNDSEMRKLKRIVDHHVALARKYQHAARRPWVPVAPDPPEPK
jgi:hypothetical protein